MVKSALNRLAVDDRRDDVEIARVNERVARGIDTKLGGRHFYSWNGTRYFDGCSVVGSRLYLADDLLSVTQVLVDADNDGTPETAYVANTDFAFWPYSAPAKGQPYRALELLQGASGSWFAGTKALGITGVFGYSNETEATGLTGTLTDETDTSLVATDTAEGVISVGDTLVQGTEQMDVTAVLGTTVTVVRGINGTTAAAHSAVAIYRRRYPRDIEEIAVLDACRLLREGQTGAGGAAGSSEFGGYQYSMSYPRIAEVINSYRIGW